MKTLTLIQGTPEWHAHRAAHFNASDAPAMMGESPYQTRDELLHRLHTGITPDIPPALQRVYAEGHRAERLARPLAQQIIGEDLYPVTGSADEGKYSASFDGLTMAEDAAFEHKLLASRLREAMFDGCTGADLPLDYQIQMEQQCMVSGCERVLFMASEWDGNVLVEERHCWYTPNLQLRADIIAGWAQLEKDLAAYVPPARAAPKPVAALQEALPALRVVGRGELTESNLDEWKALAMRRIGAINTELVTDQDFADAAEDAKWLRDVSANAKRSADAILANMTSVYEATEALKLIAKMADQKALSVEKMVKFEKDARKLALVEDVRAQLRQHISGLNERIGEALLTPATCPVDFDGAIKGKSNLDSMRSALNDALAQAKIASSAVADRISLNLRALDAQADNDSLFPDRAQLVMKQPEDLAATITARIAEHHAAEARKAEAAKAQADKAIQAAAAPATPAQTSARAQMDADPRFAAAVAGAPAAVPAGDEQATLKLGDINARLKHISVTADGLRSLGFEPAARDKRATLYTERQFWAICDSIAKCVQEAQRRALQAA